MLVTFGSWVIFYDGIILYNQLTDVDNYEVTQASCDSCHPSALLMSAFSAIVSLTTFIRLSSSCALTISSQLIMCGLSPASYKN